MMPSVTLIFSPFHNGRYEEAVGAGPNYLRKHGIATTIEELGFSVQCVTISSVDEFDGDIARSFEIMRRISTAVASACANQSFPIILSGNCNASVGVTSGLNSAVSSISSESDSVVPSSEQSSVSCAWFDAHDDFNTPDSLVSGYFDSMPVAMLAGQCFKNVCESIPGYRPMSLDRFCYIGIRDVTPEERHRVESHGIAAVWGNEAAQVDFAGGFSKILAQRPKQGIYVHLDLDCLDLSVGKVNKFSAPGGLTQQDLVDCLALIPERATPLALTVASFDPAFGDGEKIAAIAKNALCAFLKALKEKL